MVTQIIENYETLVDTIGQLITVSGYRNDYIARKVGLTTVNFSAKKARKTFSLEEIKSILQIIDNEDVEEYMMVKIMNQREKEDTMSYADFKAEMGWK